MRDFYGVTLPNALMLGTAQYPSPSVLQEAFRASGAGVATVSLRREADQGQAFWSLIRDLGVPAATASAVILSLELQGRVTRLAGGRLALS